MVSRRALFLSLGAMAVTGGAAAGYVGWQTRERPEPPGPPDTDAQGRLLWRNWSGIRSAYPAQRWVPRSEDELATTIAQHAGPIRAVGAGHSFMPLVPTPGTLLTLDAMTGLIDHDSQASTAAFHAGTRLGEVGPALAAIGQEMPNLPDINQQSLAGAIATGTMAQGETFVRSTANSRRCASSLRPAKSSIARPPCATKFFTPRASGSVPSVSLRGSACATGR